MTKEQVKDTISTHYRKLNRYANDIMPECSAEKLHQFRVEYKKMRAFLRMISSIPGSDEEINFPKKLKTTYHLTGSIRDLQLQKQRISETARQMRGNLHQYFKLLEKEIEHLTPELSSIIQANPVTESKKKANKFSPDKFKVSDFKLYVQKKQSALNYMLASGNFSDDTIHAIRKALKDLLYNLETFHNVNRVSLPAGIWNGKDEKYIHSLLDELGALQDKRIAIGLLKPHWLNSLNHNNRELTEHIKRSWLHDKTRMKQMLVKKLREIEGTSKLTNGIVLPMNKLKRVAAK